MAALHTGKPIGESLDGSGRIIKTVWNSFARTDLVDPGDGGPYELYTDGAAGSAMPSPRHDQLLRRDIGFLPFMAARPERVFVIGPGGGLDVWLAIRGGARQITAVEVNPGAVSLVREFAGYSGDLYRQPGVQVLIDEGRSLLRRQETDYDLISLSQVLTMAAERDGYSLSENATYTVEAFEDYLAHLSPDGQIALKLYDELTMTRALSVVLAAFRNQGLTDAQGLQHVTAFLDPRSEDPVPLLLVRRTPYTTDEAFELGGQARQLGFVILFLPQVWAQEPLASLERGMTTFAEIAAQSTSDISPTTDDRPFFFQFERGIPRTLGQLLGGLGAILLVGVALLTRGQRRVIDRLKRWAPLYFAALGFGFIAVEVALIQVIRLFLGHPTLAITTVLAVLLIGGGVGSSLAGRWFPKHRPRIPPWPAAAMALLLLAWPLLWRMVSQQLLSAPLAHRVAAALLALLPLGLLMGMPFPLGLRTVGRVGDRPVALAWAVNGVTSVAGSAGAVALAITGGFSRVLLAGAIAYAAAALLACLAESPDLALGSAHPRKPTG
jgi:hypothetical protein